MAEFENSSPMTISNTSPEASVSSSGNQITPPPQKRKRNLPGMPDPDAEVIALSPRTLLATNRFVCEICSKGFQRDQNLQLHRRGHNLPWKLKQRSSKEVRKRVYVCPETACVHHDPSRALGDLTGIKKHFYRKHGEKKWKCERCSKKYAVQSDWKAHMKTCGTREYRCDCGTLFSRRDSFITHRAFCDALAQESERSHKFQAVLLPPSSSPPLSPLPPPPPLSPSTEVLSPVLSIQSSGLPENPTGLLKQQGGATCLAAAAAASGDVSSSSGVFASIFASSPSAGIVSHSSHAPSSYSDLLYATAAEPMSLSMSSSLYISNSASSLFPSHPHQDHHGHYPPSPQPSMSATALLQKAAQMGSTASNASFLRGLGLPLSSSSDHQDNPSTTTATLFGNRPTTLDLLGLGISSDGGASSDGFSAFLTSIGGGFDLAAASFGGNTWGDALDRKPGLL